MTLKLAKPLEFSNDLLAAANQTVKLVAAIISLQSLFAQSLALFTSAESKLTKVNNSEYVSVEQRHNFDCQNATELQKKIQLAFGSRSFNEGDVLGR